MYKNITLLRSAEHGFYRYTPPDNYYFGKEINLVPVTFGELKQLCCDYPIVIIKQEERFSLMLLAGLDRNGAIDKDGQWKGDYIPAFLRRYPFALVSGRGYASWPSVAGLANTRSARYSVKPRC